jgi:RNA recognition motif-containing protein
MSVKIFVGGLSFSTSTEGLRDAFAAVGSVESARVVTDQDTGRSRGFGFVEMAAAEDAKAAVARLDGTELDGRRIRVEIAKPPEARNGGRPRQDGGRSRGGWRGGRGY